MHLSRLHLIAYGHFSDASVELSPGLNLVYGPNEAGKSTALRAINQLFFGFATRCEDAFLHGYPKLRVGATLRDRENEWTFVRRKANKSTLRGADDQTIVPDDQMDRWFRGIDAERYSQQFGIDYAQLVAGGRQIVEGGGDVGHALFAAASGVSNLLATRRELQEQCDALYLPKGRNQTINSQLSLWKERVRAVDEAQLSAGEWERLEREIADVQQRLDEARRMVAQRQSEQKRLLRLRDARAPLLERADLRERLRQLADSPLLADDFETRLRQGLNQREKARSTVQDRAGKIDELRRALAELIVDDRLSERADDIHDLHGRIKQFRDALADLPARRADLQQLETRMRELLSELRDDRPFDAIPGLQLPKSRVSRIRKQADELARLEAQAQKQGESAVRLRAKVDVLRGRVAAQTPPLDGRRLRELVERSQGKRDLDQTLAEIAGEMQRADRLARATLARMELSRLSFDEFLALPAPAGETTQRFEQELQELRRQAAELDRDERAARGRLRQIDQDLESQRLAQDVPTEDELGAARRRRDEGWQIVRDVWRGRLAEDDPQAAEFTRATGVDDLAEAFPFTIRQADDVSDRMRREAHAVARKAELVAERRRLEAGTAERERDRSELAARLAEWQTQWLALWDATGIKPGEPADMRQWLALREETRQQIEQVANWQRKAESLTREIHDLLEPLKAECQRLDPTPAVTSDVRPLVQWIDLGRAILQRIDAQTQAHDKLNADLERETLALQQAEAEQSLHAQQLDAARSTWREQARELGLDDDATRDGVDVAIDARERLQNTYKEATELRRRIGDIEACIADFHRDVRRLAESIDGCAIDEAPSAAVADRVSQVVRRLGENDRLQARRQTLATQLEQSLKQREQADDGLASAEASLEALRVEARGAPLEQLAEVAQQSGMKRQWQDSLAKVERSLTTIAGSVSLDELARDVDATVPEQVDEQLASIERELQELEERREQLATELGTKRSEQSRMDGGGRATQLQLDVEDSIASLQQDVETYAQLALAVDVLDQAIERYRAANQDPLLQRAAEMFRRLTLGRYVNVQAEEEDGQPRLVGIRSGGGAGAGTVAESVTVEQMSEGTSDQLFLALRLAALERYFAEHSPLPVVVDDILIKFDDQRAIAALQCLAELARSTQVVFFTHHCHVVELAASHLPRDSWARRELPAR